MLLAGCAAPAVSQEPDHAPPPFAFPRITAALLASPDPKLAANKRLVYEMYRIVLQGGYAERAQRVHPQRITSSTIPMPARTFAGAGLHPQDPTRTRRSNNRSSCR